MQSRPGLKVLSAVDFSIHSRRALRYAAAAAKRLSATLAVLYVEDPLLVAAASVAYDASALTKETVAQLRRFVHQSIGRSSRVAAECIIAVGSPAREIERTATRLDAALVVVGTQGLRGVRRLFLGSTTQQLLRVASVPVLAIPPRAPAKPSARWPGRRVVAPVDLDEHTLTDARAAAEFAHRLGATLVLVHVLPSVQTPPWIKVTGSASDRLRHTEAETELTRAADALGPATRVETRVLVGNPPEAIASFARKEFDLVILTLRRGSGVLGSRPGSMTYELLSLASTPVLALPPTSTSKSPS